MLNLSVNKYRNSGGVGIWGGRDEREKECVSVCVCVEWEGGKGIPNWKGWRKIGVVESN